MPIDEDDFEVYQAMWSLYHAAYFGVRPLLPAALRPAVAPDEAVRRLSLRLGNRFDARPSVSRTLAHRAVRLLDSSPNPNVRDFARADEDVASLRRLARRRLPPRATARSVEVTSCESFFDCNNNHTSSARIKAKITGVQYQNLRCYSHPLNWDKCSSYIESVQTEGGLTAPPAGDCVGWKKVVIEKVRLPSRDVGWLENKLKTEVQSSNGGNTVTTKWELSNVANASAGTVGAKTIRMDENSGFFTIKSQRRGVSIDIFKAIRFEDSGGLDLQNASIDYGTSLNYIAPALLGMWLYFEVTDIFDCIGGP